MFLCTVFTIVILSAEVELGLSSADKMKTPEPSKNYLDKILFPLLPIPHLSHYPPFAAIASGLVEKRHEVHLLSNSLTRDNKTLALFKANKIISYKANTTDEQYLKTRNEFISTIMSDDYGFAGLKIFFQMIKLVSLDCRNLLSDTITIAKLRNENYDLLVSDVFFPCDMLLARHLGLSLVAFTAVPEYEFFRKPIFAFPSELSYIPERFSGFTEEMTLLQKVQNVLFRLANSYIMPLLLLKDFVQIQKDFNIDPGTPLLDIMDDAVLWLSSSDFSLEFPQPIMPNYIPVGGLALRQAQPLSKELETFVEDSGDHGVIILSLGSLIDSLADDHTTTLIASVFSRLHQRVVWRHTGEEPANLGNNTKILKRIPQNDLLGHPKTRLFIGHGGLNGVYEALYHAVPMILIPLMAPDQWDTAARVMSKGMGLQLDSKTLTEKKFYDAVTDVLNEPRYQDRVSHYSAILRDLPPAKDRAVFWIEHVLKFGGEHLRAHAFELNLIQYYLIDVAAFLLLVGFVIAFILRLTCKFCCRRCIKCSKAKVE